MQRHETLFMASGKNYQTVPSVNVSELYERFDSTLDMFRGNFLSEKCC